MKAPDWLIVFGLVVTVLGSVAAASNLLAPEWLLDPKVQAAHKSSLEQSRDVIKNSYQTPPYPQDVVTEKQAEADRVYREELEALNEEIHQAGYKDTWRRQRATLWGLLLIALGSVLQGAAALLS